MRRQTLFFVLVAAVICVLPVRSLAQSVDQVVTPPPNLVLANYDSVPVGPFGGLEGSAYAARVGDPSAAWFNPAGLSRQRTAQISGSGGVYESTSVSPQALPDNGGSLHQVPNFVGFTFNIQGGLTAGFALVTTNSWSQQTDTESITSSPTGQERFAYSADSEYSRRVAAIGVGYQGGGAWRVGGGFAFSLMSLRLVQTFSDRAADATGLSTLLVTARATGSALQLRTQGGVQDRHAEIPVRRGNQESGTHHVRQRRHHTRRYAQCRRRLVRLVGVRCGCAARVSSAMGDPRWRRLRSRSRRDRGGRAGIHFNRCVFAVIHRPADRDLCRVLVSAHRLP